MPAPRIVRMSAHRIHRKDGNHDEVVDKYLACGYKVKSTTMVGEGFSDLVIHRDDFPPGFVKLVEVKDGDSKTSPKQDAFMAEGWPVDVVRSVEDILP